MWLVDESQYRMMDVDDDCTLKEYGEKHNLAVSDRTFYIESDSNTSDQHTILEEKVIVQLMLMTVLISYYNTLLGYWDAINGTT